VVESFFHTLKVERIDDRRYAIRAAAYADVADPIERFYNRCRRLSRLRQMPPAMYE
jgi:transposase InsO family protein